jgi:hypothetical protein
MIIATDIVETFYSTGKSFACSDVLDTNRIALRLPAFSGVLTEDDIKGLLSISVCPVLLNPPLAVD